MPLAISASIESTVDIAQIRRTSSPPYDGEAAASVPSSFLADARLLVLGPAGTLLCDIAVSNGIAVRCLLLSLQTGRPGNRSFSPLSQPRAQRIAAPVDLITLMALLVGA